MGLLFNRPATVLLYHGVGRCHGSGRTHECLCIPPEAFAGQMEYLSRHRRVVPLAEAIAGRSTMGAPPVAITFDDGYRNLLTEAIPILQRYRFPATVFVPTRWLGDRNLWVDGYECAPLDIMSAGELHEVESKGVTVESHGHAHIDLKQAADDEVHADLTESVALLTELLGHRPRFLAYPFGTHSPAVEELARSSGFEAVFTAFLDGAGGTPGYAFDRVDMDGGESRLRLALKTAGGYPALRGSRLASTVASVLRRVIPRAQVSR